ncbi:response regulator [Nocardioides sp. GCM10027113]|uniref:response regulator n=1 Tax=unclassified Nocardioides TaxID=2615069 RepID=UPI00360C8BA5
MDAEGEFYRQLVDASRDGLWVFDEHGITRFANRRVAELVGLTAEEMVGLPVDRLLDAEGRDQLGIHLAELASAPDDDEGVDNLEVQLLRPDGSAVWVLTSHSPIRDSSGRRLGWLHRVTDHTEQRRLRESLRRREQLLADAQQIAGIGSWEWDVTTDSVTWSDQLYRIYDVEPGELEATYAGFLEFVHPEDRDIVTSAVGSIFEGEQEFDWVARVLPRGGGLKHVRGLGRVERGRDGAPLRIGGTAQDVTERVLADQAVAEATRRLHLLQALTTAANRSSHLDAAVEAAATTLPQFTQWRAVCHHAVLPDGGLGGVDLRHTAEGWHVDCDPALADRARHTGEVESGPASGHEDTHTLVAMPVLLEGEVVCVLEIVADEAPLSDEARSLVAQVSAQLGQVAQREAAAAQLAEARDEAMEASRLKSEFLATMSHEIRTPMNGVIGLNDLLLRTELDAHQRRLAEGLQGAGLTLLGLINDILDLSKIEAGKLELEEVDFDVREVFDKTAALLAGRAQDQGIELVVACHPEVPQHLRGDPGRLGQVLANLGSNAVKFTEEGEVTIRAVVDPDHPDHTGRAADPDTVVLRVDVTDTGVGIPPDIQPTLFDAFTQADPSTTRKHGGTGLGLAISRQLVQALGGRIDVSSEVGKGSTFTFTAVLQRAEGTPARKSRRTDHTRLHGRRALVVDDNRTNRLILQEQLTAWEMSVVTVGTSEEAMSAVRDATRAGRPFEVALLDMLLPDGDGLALARAIAAGTPGATPRLMLLSSGQHVDLGAAQSAGIAVSLTKPVQHSELLDRLLDLVDHQPEAAPTPTPSATPAGAGGRILIVEDNPVNQMVAVGLLQNAGYETDVVDDGQAAVEVLAGPHEYDAVLMDCRMPRMDGFDATRQIRSDEAGAARVPIIAMTASALEGEQDRCLAVGMDDFLTKPVDPERLLRVVRRWVGGASATPEATTEEAAVIDRDRMRMLDGLRRQGSSLFERASDNFLSQAGEAMAEVREAARSADPIALSNAAHRLKGSATNLGLPALGLAANALEEVGLGGRDGDVPALLAALEHELARALTELASLRRTGL